MSELEKARGPVIGEVITNWQFNDVCSQADPPQRTHKCGSLLTLLSSNIPELDRLIRAHGTYGWMSYDTRVHFLH